MSKEQHKYNALDDIFNFCAIVHAIADHGNSFETVEKKGLDTDKIAITQEKDNSNRNVDHVPHHRPRGKFNLMSNDAQ